MQKAVQCQDRLSSVKTRPIAKKTAWKTFLSSMLSSALAGFVRPYCMMFSNGCLTLCFYNEPDQPSKDRTPWFA